MEESMMKSTAPVTFTKTIEVLAGCFQQAEKGACDAVRDACPMIDEREITFLFQLQLFHELKRASNEREIAAAIVEDIKRAIPRLDGGAIHGTFDGVVAETSWHNARTEGKTGADFGLVITTPRIHAVETDLQLDSEGPRFGLLVQAKKKAIDTRRTELTLSQRRVLKDRLKFAAVVLYRTTDGENRALAPFEWYSCEKSEMKHIQHSLRHDRFPKTERQSTAEAVCSLGRGEIGTPDKCLIEKFISPAGQRTVFVRVGWKGGNPPMRVIHNCIAVQTRAELRVHVIPNLA
jgi:hypothetical protein